MVFSIDFTGHCNEGCHFGDGPGALAIVGSQLHLLVFVGLWVYSFIHRDIFLWTVNVMASTLLGICHIFHKIDVLGEQPPCLGCIAAIYSRFYDLEGSAIPSSPVALVCYYMLVIYACPLELGLAYRYDEGAKRQLQRNNRRQHHHRCIEEQQIANSASDRILWNNLSHLDVLIVPVWAAGARLYAGLTTTKGIVAGTIMGAAAVLLLFAVVRSLWYRNFVRYVIDGQPIHICGIAIGPIPGLAAVLHFFSFETRLLDIIWNNLDAAREAAGLARGGGVSCPLVI